MKLTHLEHIEDNLMEHPELVSTALEHLVESVGKFSLKWDGAPSLVFGKCPQTHKFFMGTKSVFNKDPKVNYTVDDILVNHGANSDLASRLMYVFTVLQKQYCDDRVLQADLLFCKSDITFDNCYAVFTPNVLTYKTHSENISGALIGLAIHTEYVCTSEDCSLQTMTAKQITSQPQLDNVYLAPIDARVKTPLHSCFMNNMMYALDKHDPVFVQEKIIKTNLWSEYKVFYNSCIKDDISYELDASVEYKAFTEWMVDRYANKMKKKKTHAGMKTQMYALDEMLGLLHDPKVRLHFEMCSKARVHVLDAKKQTLRELRSSVRCYAYYDDEPCNHEGAVMDVDGSLMKLVDRRVFSKRNFAKNGNNYKK